MSQRGPGPIPNRWLHCPRKSDSLIADKFLAFKTPLSDRFDSQMPLQCSFPPEMIFDNMKLYKVKVGLWIDLTNTSRFYDRRVVEENNCQYIKLNCKGHGETPSPEQTKAFIHIVEEFIKDHPFEIIGVHCTHGFNRTGFLIVSYMVEKYDFSVEAALMAFARARPPGIYKQDYIHELFKRYDDVDDAMTAPPLPQWCFEYDDTDGGSSSKVIPDGNDDDVQSTSEENGGTKRVCEDDENDVESLEPEKKKKKREFFKKNAQFMDGVPGVTLVCDTEKLTKLVEKLHHLTKWKANGFPGLQPVSMDRKNMTLLLTKPYMVSWKADGTRYMMLIDGPNEVYFFDRDNACFQVQGLRFLNRHDMNQHLRDTLLDGEMVIDIVKGHKIPRYLIYDIITFESKPIGTASPFNHRLDVIKNEIIIPRHNAITDGLIIRNSEPFSVRTKDFWLATLNIATKLLSPKFRSSLSHEPDGLIFQPLSDPYVTGPCPAVLKWKPAELNSVDFKLKIGKEEGIGIVTKKIGYLYVGGHDNPIDKIKLTKELKDMDNRIIECKNEKGQWIFMRERTDKSFPNSYSTAMSVIYSIRFPVTEEILFDILKRCESIQQQHPAPRNRPPQHKQLAAPPSSTAQQPHQEI